MTRISWPVFFNALKDKNLVSQAHEGNHTSLHSSSLAIAFKFCFKHTSVASSSSLLEFIPIL
jgi:hypothetical protein